MRRHGYSAFIATAGKVSDDVACAVELRFPAERPKTGCNPLSALVFKEGRRRNSDYSEVLFVDPGPLAPKPVEPGANGRIFEQGRQGLDRGRHRNYKFNVYSSNACRTGIPELCGDSGWVMFF